MVEDQIQALQTATYNTQEICDQLAEFVRSFPTLPEGERRLVVDSLISEVVLKHQEVAVALTPPLAGLGFLSTSLAPREEKRKVPELHICLAYDLAKYYGAGSDGVSRVGMVFSGRQYALQYPALDAPTVRAPTILRGLHAPALQAAGAVCATAQAL